QDSKYDHPARIIPKHRGRCRLLCHSFTSGAVSCRSRQGGACRKRTSPRRWPRIATAVQLTIDTQEHSGTLTDTQGGNTFPGHVVQGSEQAHAAWTCRVSIFSAPWILPSETGSRRIKVSLRSVSFFTIWFFMVHLRRWSSERPKRAISAPGGNRRSL